MKMRESQVGRLLAAKQANDNGTMSDAEMLKLVGDSTGHEINEAMDRSGQSRENWAAVKGPWRSRS